MSDKQTRTCVHFWRLESPTAGVAKVRGVCRLCGATRTWLAGLSIRDWEEDPWQESEKAAKAVGRAVWAA